MECGRRSVLGFHRKTHCQPESLDFDPEPAVRICGLAVLGHHHGADAQSRLPLLQVRIVHALRHRRFLWGYIAHSQHLFHPHRRRAKHDLFHYRASDDSGDRHGLRPAGQEYAPLGVPGAGAAFRFRRRKFCLFDVQHQFLLPQTRSRSGTGLERQGWATPA